MSDKKKKDKKNEKPLKIDGEFLDVFKVVKEDKERKAQKKKEEDKS